MTTAWIAARWRRLREQTERGAVMFWVIPLMIGLVAMAGLIVDGGSAIAAREKAEDVAQQAARAGADALSPAALHDAVPGGLTADRAAAQAAAARVLAAAGIANPNVSVHGDSVTVSVTIHQKTQILSAFGLNQVSGTATSTAIALHGNDAGGTG